MVEIILFEYIFAFVAYVDCKLELDMYPDIDKLADDKFGADIIPLAFKLFKPDKLLAVLVIILLRMYIFPTDILLEYNPPRVHNALEPVPLVRIFVVKLALSDAILIPFKRRSPPDTSNMPPLRVIYSSTLTLP